MKKIKSLKPLVDEKSKIIRYGDDKNNKQETLKNQNERKDTHGI